ncbi:yeats family-domain-containing protein [Syncephalis fuscata]|nr:yeats family-domain-containing protein [Syncephalis fuscata]
MSSSNILEEKLAEPAVKQVVQQVIEREFNLEILLKRRELSLIRQELDKGERILGSIHRYILYGEDADTEYTNTRETRYTTTKQRSLSSSDRFNGQVEEKEVVRGISAPVTPLSSSGTTTPIVHRKRRLARATVNQKPKYGGNGPTQPLYSRRSDGTYVVIICPTCQRGNFLNMQGFVNHFKLKHRGDLASHEEATELCGIPVNEEEIPMDHLCRLRFNDTLPERLKGIAERGAARDQLKRTKPKIKVFEEAVDIHQDTTTTTTTTNNNSNSIESNPLQMQIDSNTMTNDKVNTVTKSIHTLHNRSLTSEMETVPTLLSPVPITTLSSSGSRFYVKRRVTVGNTSQYIPPLKRSEDKKNHSHRWMVYIVGPPQDTNEISTYIKRVRFYMHPSYRPNDIVDVLKPPFQLIRYGWGEFPVRLQLFFSDTRNKPVDIVHMLRLDDSHTGGQTQGAERTFDLELDRNTQFKQIIKEEEEKEEQKEENKTQVIKEEKEEKEEISKDILDKNTIIHTNTSNMMDVKKEVILDTTTNENKLLCDKHESEEENTINNDVINGVDKKDKAFKAWLKPHLLKAYQYYPLIKPLRQMRSDHVRISYRLASSIDEFTLWTHGRQKSVYWQQAKAISAYLKRQMAQHPPVMTSLSTMPLPTMRFILDWCRQQSLSLMTSKDTMTSKIQ